MLVKLLDIIVKMDMSCEFHVTKKSVKFVNMDSYTLAQTTNTSVIMDMPSWT